MTFLTIGMVSVNAGMDAFTSEKQVQNVQRYERDKLISHKIDTLQTYLDVNQC